MTFGLNGWFWECEDGKTIGVVITKASIMNKFFPKGDFKHVSGDEYSVYMSKERFKAFKMNKKLRVDKLMQRELEAYHNAKYGTHPLPAPEVQNRG